MLACAVMIAPLALWLALVPSALARDTVLHAEDRNAARARVSQLIGVSEDDLSAASVRELFGPRPPALTGGGKTVVCTEAPSDGRAVGRLLDRAEGTVAYMDVEQALVELDAATQALGCLSEAVEPSVASRLFFLRGIILHADGKTDLAKRAFRQAHLFTPDLKWDDNFPPDGRDLFDAAGRVVDEQQVTLELVPPPEQGTVFVDGRPLEGATAHLPVGDHILQVGRGSFTTVSVHLQEGTEPVLVLPANLDESVVTWPDDPALQPALAAALSVGLGAGSAVYITGGKRTWKHVVGQPGFTDVGDGGGTVGKPDDKTPVAAPPKDKPAKDQPPKEKRGGKVAGFGMAIGGGVVGAAGAGILVAAIGPVAREVDNYNSVKAQDGATDQDILTAYNKLESTRQSAAGTYTAGWVGVGVGAALAATGVFLVVRTNARVAPAWNGGPGLRVRF